MKAKPNSFWAKFSLPLSEDMLNSFLQITLFVACVSVSIVLVLVTIVYFLNHLNSRV